MDDPGGVQVRGHGDQGDRRISRRDQVLELLAEVGIALDDDDIGGRLNINRHYVNTVCRTLAAEGVVAREPGPDGKLHNRLVSSNPVGDGPLAAPRASRPRMRAARPSPSQCRRTHRHLLRVRRSLRAIHRLPRPKPLLPRTSHRAATSPRRCSIAARRHPVPRDCLRRSARVGHASHGQAEGQGRRL